MMTTQPEKESDYAKAMKKLERKKIHREDEGSGSIGKHKRWFRQKMIGSGGFGKVYLAQWAKSNSKMPPTMAVKTAPFSKSAELAMESRLLKKFRKCPFILDTYGSEVTQNVEGKKLFNVFLEFAQRGSAEDWIHKFENVGLPQVHVRRFTQSVLKGLEYIHDKGFVHCDIKPANLFLVCNGPYDAGFGSYIAKIGDLGLAKRADKHNVMKRSDFTQGTTLYMSPEVLHQNIQEPPADIWALGCTVLEMLTGKEWELDECGIPIVTDQSLDDVAKDFLNKCFVVNPLERYTADMLLKHQFVCTTFLPIRKVRVQSRSTAPFDFLPLPLPVMGAA